MIESLWASSNNAFRDWGRPLWPFIEIWSSLRWRFCGLEMRLRLRCLRPCETKEVEMERSCRAVYSLKDYRFHDLADAWEKMNRSEGILSWFRDRCEVGLFPHFQEFMSFQDWLITLRMYDLRAPADHWEGNLIIAGAGVLYVCCCCVEVLHGKRNIGGGVLGWWLLLPVCVACLRGHEAFVVG